MLHFAVVAVAATVATDGGDDEKRTDSFDVVAHRCSMAGDAGSRVWLEVELQSAQFGSSVDNVGNYRVGNSLVDLLHSAPFRDRQNLVSRLQVAGDGNLGVCINRPH